MKVIEDEDNLSNKNQNSIATKLPDIDSIYSSYSSYSSEINPENLENKLSPLISPSVTIVPKATTGTNIILYDGTTNKLPSETNSAPKSPWFDYQDSTSILGGNADISTSGGVTTLETDNQAYAGYINYGIESVIPPALTSEPLNSADFPTLDRSTGYVLSFTVQLKAEDHTTSGTAKKDSDELEDRAGFSVIALSDDNKGVEIGFWEDRIWVQDDGAKEPEDDPNGTLFTQAEGVDFDTKTAPVNYDLAIKDDNYTLYANDTSILSGEVRDYTAFIPESSLLPDPYELDNFLFFGDNTPTSSAEVEIKEISITTDIKTPNAPISGTSNADLLIGSGISDTIDSKAGNDIIIAKTGNDTINAGDNDDIIFGDLFGNQSRSRFGSSLKMKDIIYGGEGDDIIHGGAGDDEIYGEAGSDRLMGDSGDDTIWGGLGEDIIRGGIGKDTFVLDINQGTDTIVDFYVGQDIIALEGGLTFSDLSITNGNNAAIIQQTGNSDILAILNNVEAAQLSENSFSFNIVD
ncbi:MAG: calcium-binding protein [Cyanobacteria bacterium P01_A01_bin.45]